MYFPPPPEFVAGPKFLRASASLAPPTGVIPRLGPFDVSVELKFARFAGLHLKRTDYDFQGEVGHQYGYFLFEKLVLPGRSKFGCLYGPF